MNDSPTPSSLDRETGAKPETRQMPCYVIGLADVPERWQPLITALASLGVVAQFWPAVDGRRSRPKLRPGERLRSRAANRMLGCSPLNSPEIGCFLAHYRLLVHAYNAGHTRIAILEDDAVPNKQLPNTLRAIAQLDASFGLVHLDATAPHASYVRQLIEAHYAGFPLSNGIALWPGQVAGRDHLMGTHGLVLHRQTIAILLDRLIPLYRPYDIQLLKYSGIRAHYVFPPVATPGNLLPSQTMVDWHGQLRQYNLRKQSSALQIPLHWLWWLLQRAISYRHIYIWMYPRTFTDHIRTLFGLVFKKNWPSKIDSFWPTALAREKSVVPEPQQTANSHAARRPGPQHIR